MHARGGCDRLLFGVLCLLLASPMLFAQNPDQGQAASADAKSGHDARLEKLYQKWLDEDVHWIITDQERAEYAKLTTVEQRDAFIEAFWERRNPTPGGENGFKEEHYRRLDYANTNFAHYVPGYKTDRGHYYIAYGPADSVDTKLSPPSMVWHYRHIDVVGENVVLRFVDACACGEYKLVGNPPDKPADGPN